MGTQATRDTPLTPVLRAMDIQATQDGPLTPPLRATVTKTALSTLPTRVPVMDIPWLAILATACWKSGLRGPSTLSSLPAEFRPTLTFNA